MWGRTAPAAKLAGNPRSIIATTGTTQAVRMIEIDTFNVMLGRRISCESRVDNKPWGSCQGRRKTMEVLVPVPVSC